MDPNPSVKLYASFANKFRDDGPTIFRGICTVTLTAARTLWRKAVS